MYEALFLFDTSAARDWAGMEQEIRRLCERIGATLHVCVKFDERKLAFEIKRRKRGTYVLAYFDAAPEKIVEMERDTLLSEVLLRSMIVRIEPLPAERLAALKAHPAETPLMPHSGEPRRDHDEGGRDRGDRGGGRGGWGDRRHGGGRDGGRPSEERFDEVPVDATVEA